MSKNHFSVRNITEDVFTSYVFSKCIILNNKSLQKRDPNERKLKQTRRGLPDHSTGQVAPGLETETREFSRDHSHFLQETRL